MKKAYIFDLDGTLVESGDGIVASAKHDSSNGETSKYKPDAKTYVLLSAGNAQ